MRYSGGVCNRVSAGNLRNRTVSSSTVRCRAHTHDRGQRRLLALDVEYCHFRRHLCLHDDSAGQHPALADSESAAAWIAVVDEAGHALLDSRCSPPLSLKSVQWVGGVHVAELQGAPALADLAARVADLLPGSRLIGHGLRKDLLSMGLRPDALVPDCELFDLMSVPAFQNRSGSAYSLKRLAAKHLRRNIHAQGRRHSAVEDARVAMQLYTGVVLEEALAGSYDDLLTWHTQQALAQLDAWRRSQGML